MGQFLIMEYYTAIKNEMNLSDPELEVSTWMNLTNILSKTSKSQKNTDNMIALK